MTDSTALYEQQPLKPAQVAITATSRLVISLKYAQ